MKSVLLGIAMLLAAMLGGMKAYLDHNLRTQFNASIQAVAHQASIDYQDLRTSLLGSVILSGLHFTVPPYPVMQIDTLALNKAYQFYYSDSWPPHIQIAIKNFQFPISDQATPVPSLISALGYAPYYINAKELRSLGYTHYNADLILTAQTNHQQLHVTGTLKTRTWGHLIWSLDLTNVPIPTQWLSSIEQIRLATFTLTYIDKGLVNRVFTWLAQRNKISLDEFKPRLMTKLKNDLNAAKIPLDTNSFAQLQQFVQAPNRLTIHLQPHSPILMSTFGNILLDRMGLKISTTDTFDNLN